jgi:hypothetical protein
MSVFARDLNALIEDALGYTGWARYWRNFVVPVQGLELDKVRWADLRAYEDDHLGPKNAPAD